MAIENKGYIPSKATSNKPVVAKPISGKPNLNPLDKAKLTPEQQAQQTQTAQNEATRVATDAFQKAGGSPVVATRLAGSSEVAAKSTTEELKHEDRKAEQRTVNALGKAPAPQVSYKTQLHKAISKLENAFNQATELLVGEKFHQGKKHLSALELTNKQKDMIARATAAPASAARNAFVQYALNETNGVIAKLKKNQENENIDPELIEVACKIASSFGGNV